jgi:hypothetical protein
MKPATHETAGLMSNSPTRVQRLIAWDWRDGPTEGLLRTDDGSATYYFRLLEERPSNIDDKDIRVFGLYESTANAFEALVASFVAHQMPRWPIWSPLGEFPEKQIENAAERLIDSIKSGAGPLSWLVVAPSLFETVRACPVVESPVA